MLKNLSIGFGLLLIQIKDLLKFLSLDGNVCFAIQTEDSIRTIKPTRVLKSVDWDKVKKELQKNIKEFIE